MIASAVLIVLQMMGAENTRNMYSNLAEKNKYDCLKLHHVGYLIKQIDDARNHKYITLVGRRFVYKPPNESQLNLTN
jgi:hypothetical protein